MMMHSIAWISPDDRLTRLPDPDTALAEPNGLLAVGGALTVERLLDAYARGIFPWFTPDHPVMWWSPDPRSVLVPGRLRISRSLRKRLRAGGFRPTMDRDFPAVINACAAPRRSDSGTWITAGMIEAYSELHRRGFAHSVEVWRGDELVGGLYGVALGGMFFGESMFSRVSDASKVALVHLAAQLRRRGFDLIDCQMPTPHLETLGARTVPRRIFTDMLEANRCRPTPPGAWVLDPEIDPMIAGGG